MKKIQLDITPAVAGYAKEYGALHDKESGWYCFEPVPIEIEEFISEAEKFKKRPDAKITQCPKCGGQMQIKTSHSGNIFWSCMSFPKCRGSLSVDDAKHSSFAKVSIPAKVMAPKDKGVLGSGRTQNFEELAEMGIRELGNQKKLLEWLAEPKIALKGNKPIDFLNTDEGYEKVISLLRAINE